jgi:hypothetical protein
MSLGPDLCPRILHGPDVSVLLHGPDLWSGILHNLCWGILYGLYGPDLCPCIFLGRPSLELLEQGFRWWLTVFHLTLTGGFRSGSNFVARRRVRCGGLVV